MTEIFFLSYMESNADKNWHRLHQRFPHAQRLHGVQGVKNAHQKIAASAKAEFFFVVDGDNEVHDTFDFEPPADLQRDALYVWRALNPVNELCYGFGGIKLYNKWLLLENHRSTSVDIATSIAPIYVPVPVVASITRFNCSPRESWRGAFREAAKLTINTLNHPLDGTSRARLHVWRTQGESQDFGKECLLGANMGHSFAVSHHQNVTELSRINDFDWLNTLYDRRSQTD